MAGGNDSKRNVRSILGGVSIPRNTNPRIRANIRRDDPDGGNAEPHYTGLNGTSLDIDVTPVGPLNIAFTSDNLDDALTALNAASPANLKAFEEDGFLVLQNLNGGAKNTLKIDGGNAAAILGFKIATESSEGLSIAGEVATAPPGRYKNQNNPQGTKLIAGDEDLTSESLNRSIVGVAELLENHYGVYDLLVPVVVHGGGTVETHAGSGKKVVYLFVGRALPRRGGYNVPTGPGRAQLDSLFSVLDTDGAPIIKIDEATEKYARVMEVYYEESGTGSPALNGAATFTDWNTYDGKSIYGIGPETLNRQAPVSIDAIQGDIIVASAADFDAAKAGPGDTVVIESATNDDPFNHNGEYIVLEKLSSSKIRVRPKTPDEKFYTFGATPTTENPTALNSNLPGGSNYGTVRIVVGNIFKPKGTTVAVEVPDWVSGSVTVRSLQMVPIRDLADSDDLLASLTDPLWPNQNTTYKEFKDHIIDAVAGRRHGAADVDAPAVAGSPDSLTVGTVEDQLAELLNHINNLIAGQVSYGGGIDWADTVSDTPAGPTTNPATTMEGQLDKILNDLAGPGIDGVAKIRAIASGDLVGGNLRDQLDQLDTEWLKLNRVNTVSGDNEFTGTNTFSESQVFDGPASETAPALQTSVSASGAAAYKLIWEMPAEFGTAVKARLYIGGNKNLVITVNAEWDGANWNDDVTATASKFTWEAGGIRVQYASSGAGSWIDSNWKDHTLHDLTNETHVFNKIITSVGADYVGSGVNADLARLLMPLAAATLQTQTRTCLFEWAGPEGEGNWRVYIAEDSSNGHGQWELTFNAKWTNSSQNWSKDSGSWNSMRYRYTRNIFAMDKRVSATAWDDTVFTSLESTGWLNYAIFDSTANSVTLENFGLSVDGILNINSFAYVTNGPFTINNVTNGYIQLYREPSATLSVTNRLYANNMVKFYANVRWSSTQSYIYDGFNVTTLDHPSSTLNRLYIAANMQNTSYWAIAFPYDLIGVGGAQIMRIHTVNTGDFRIAGYNSAGTALTIGNVHTSGGYALVGGGDQ